MPCLVQFRQNGSPSPAAQPPSLQLFRQSDIQKSKMLQAATAWFSSSQISQNYSISSTSSNALSSTSDVTPGVAPIAPFQVGLWKVQEAHHKTTMKKASVWTCEKRKPEFERLPAGAKETVIEALKAEVWWSLLFRCSMLTLCHLGLGLTEAATSLYTW